MRLASRIGKSGNCGEIVLLVAEKQFRKLKIPGSPSIVNLIESWDELQRDLKVGKWLGELENNAISLGPPFRRTSQAIYGSAFGNRSARVAQTHEAIINTLLAYQGTSDYFLGTDEPFERIGRIDAELDFEAELFVLTDSVEQNCTVEEAESRIRFVGGCNDFTYRDLIRRERINGFGFIQGKPVTSLAPIVVEPDDLGDSWNNGKPILTAEVWLNGRVIGKVPSSEMQYSFQEIIAHAAATRPLSAGTLISSGTLSAGTAVHGFCSIVELRQWQANRGIQLTPYLSDGDSVEIFWSTNTMHNIFGSLRNSIFVKSP